MDTVLNVLTILVISLAVFLAVGFVGFKVKAPLRWPYGEPTATVDYFLPTPHLPKALHTWLFQSPSGAPAPTSLVAWGRGKIASRLPLIGKIWLPLSWTLYLEPGKNFILQNRITWFGRRFIRGGEEFRNQKGAFILGNQLTQAPYLDETERAMLWFFSFWLAPGSLLYTNAIDISESAQSGQRLSVRVNDETLQHFDVEIDTDSGLPCQISGVRKGSRSGGDYPYVADLSQPQRFDDAGEIPTLYLANWDHDFYIQYELAGLQMNQDVSEAMQIGIEELPAL